MRMWPCAVLHASQSGARALNARSQLAYSHEQQHRERSMTRNVGLALVAAVLLAAAPAVAAHARMVHGAATQAGADYTAALNVLYSHGWHDVTSLSKTNGVVRAIATNPEGKQATAQINVRTMTLQAE